MKRSIIAERLLGLRKQKAWTVRDLAERAGLNFGYINAIERGVKRPSIESLYDLAKALDTSASYLLGDTNDPEIPIANIQRNLESDLHKLLSYAEGDSLVRETALMMARLSDAEKIKIYEYTQDQCVIFKCREGHNGSLLSDKIKL